MSKCELIVPVYEFRPLIKHSFGDVFRYNNGIWTLDDGEYDIAFAHPANCYAYGVCVPSRENIIWSWTKNGRWGASVTNHPRGNAWHYMLRKDETQWGKCWPENKHLNYIAKEEAMNFVCEQTGCSNGVGPEFHINDPYIKKGLLRLRETKEVIKFPDIFNCMYCGKINWHEAEQEPTQ